MKEKAKKILSVGLAAGICLSIGLPSWGAVKQASEGEVSGGQTSEKQASGKQTAVIAGAPSGLTIENDGTILVTDTFQKAVWKVTAAEGQSRVSVFSGNTQLKDAGQETVSSYWDGAHDQAGYGEPWDIVAYGDGYAVSDAENHVIRYLVDGQVKTLVGQGKPGLYDGKATEATFHRPAGLTVDPSGRLYVADMENHRIRVVEKDGTVRTFAGSFAGCEDGAALEARFNQPTGVFWSDGVLYVADAGNHRICKVAEGKVTTIAGGLFQVTDEQEIYEGAYADGAVSEAKFSSPQNLVVAQDGAIYVADAGNSAIRVIKDGVVSTFYRMDDASLDQFCGYPRGMALTEQGLMVSDVFTGEIRVLELGQ